MRCLEECRVPTSEDNPRFQALLMSTGQNLRAIQHSMANEACASFAGELDTWHEHHMARIKDTMTLNIMNEASADIRLLLDPDTDPHLIEWISRTSGELRSAVRTNLLNEVTADTLAPWVIEATAARKAEALAKIDREVAEAATQRRIEAEAEAETDAFTEAKSFYELRLAQLKAEAEADVQRDLVTFRAELRAETNTRKNNARAEAAVAAAAPSLPASLTAGPSQKSRKGTRAEHRHDPITRAKRSESRSHSRAQSPESPTTPKASPAVESPPRTLKEPPMDVEVGPLSNSLEMLIATVPDELVPRPPPSHIPPVPTEPQTPNDPASLAIQTMLQSFSSSMMAQIDQRLAPLSSQLSALTSDVVKLKQPKAVFYSPSVPQGGLFNPGPTLPVDDQTDETALSALDYTELAQIDYVMRDDSQEQDERDCAISLMLCKVAGISADCRNRSDLHNCLLLDMEDSYRVFCYQNSLDSNYPLMDPFDIQLFTDFHSRRVKDTADREAFRLHRDAADKAAEATNATKIPPRPSKPTTAPAPRRPNVLGLPPPSPPPQPRATAAPKSPSAWVVVPNKNIRGQGKKQTQTGGAKPTSYASAVAAQAAQPPAAALPPSLSRDKLSAMNIKELSALYRTRFNARIRPGISKEGLIDAYLAKAANPAPAPSLNPKPRGPQIVRSTDYTVVRSASSTSINDKQRDPASIVRVIQAELRQIWQGVTPRFTLLSGRWSSLQSPNFVLTFAGRPSHDDILHQRHCLMRPFGPGCILAPQRGYARILVNRVPVIPNDDGSLASSEQLHEELSHNPGYQGLTILSMPRWLKADVSLDAAHASITFAFLDEDGSHMRSFLSHPPSLFGERTKCKKFESKQLLRQCKRCHALGHEVSQCSRPKTLVVCAICARGHTTEKHASLCPTKQKHTSVCCSCPVSCFNCKAKGLRAAGHIVTDLCCPLRKHYRTETRRSGDTSDEEQRSLDALAADVPMAQSPVPTSQTEEVFAPASDGPDTAVYNHVMRCSTPQLTDIASGVQNAIRSVIGARPLTRQTLLALSEEEQQRLASLLIRPPTLTHSTHG